MARYTQANRALAIQTPLGADALLLERLTGVEAISEPYRFHLDLLAEKPVDFDRLMGQPATVTIALPNRSRRIIHGIIAKLSRGGRVPAAEPPAVLLRYRAELVPELWVLQRRVQSRIFQQQSIPEILKAVLRDDWNLDVSWQLTGTYHPRNYCVQYQESDFQFVSRLMEDEGIGYFFQHAADRHTLVITDNSAGYPPLESLATLGYSEEEGGARSEPRIREWEKSQELRTCKHTLRDYHFQLPESDLEASQAITSPVKVGTVAHRLDHQRTVHGQELLEAFAYPGGYAQRFDGIGKTGADQPGDLPRLYEDNRRMARLRLEEEAARAIEIRGSSDACHLLPGHELELDQHFEDNGDYLLTRVEHEARLTGVYTAGSEELVYRNRFTCLPAGLLFRPARRTPRPRIEGPQTATVVGPPGAEIFLDKYGRVKLRFRWDRSTGAGGERSCWVRVAQVWAGNRWGAFFWPRIGHEVVVAFEEGDPDRPLIVGSVYNDKNMPPVHLPINANLGGIKSCIVGGDPLTQFNAVVFHDTPGVEYIEVHSRKAEMSLSEANQVRSTTRAQFTFRGSF